MSATTLWKANTLFSPLGLSLLMAALGAVLLILPMGQALEESVGLSLLFKQRGVRPPPAEVVVVPIEKTSADTLKLANKPESWPRRLHAQLIERLHSAGAAAIVFDIHFKEARDPVEDSALAAALRRAGNVVLFAYLDRDTTQPHAHLERLIPPHEPFSAAAAAVAPFALPKLPVRVSRFWTFQESAGGIATLPMAALEQYALPALPALAKNLERLRPEAALPLQRALADSRSAALAETRKFMAQVDPAVWREIGGDLNGDLMQRLDALHHNYRMPSRPYLNFYGPPRTVTTISYARALTGTPAELAAQFRGKVVLIGFAEQRQAQQRDSFYTAFSQTDGLDLSGVEIAATAFANLLHRDSLQPPDRLADLLLVVAYGLLIAVSCRKLPALAAVAAGLALAVAYYFAAAELFAAQHVWLPLAIPLFVLTPLALFLGIFGHYWQSQQERKHLRSTFGHYVPEHVIDRVLTHQDGLRAPGEPLYGICLATDAARYTHLAETMSPAKLSVLMNEYYETLFAPVRARQGIISDVVGDAMLAIWTGPYTQGLLRSQAIDAALAIRDAVAEFGKQPDRPALTTRIGLHCGEIVMGNVGALDHFEYRAVGDIVNTASRIQSLNKQMGTELLASDGVIADIRGIVTRPLGRYLLAGKQQSVTIHEVVGREAEVDSPQREFLVRFAAALTLFNLGQWQAARDAFRAVHQNAPDDGPTRFFVEQCERHLVQAPSDWQGVLALSEK